MENFSDANFTPISTFAPNASNEEIDFVAHVILMPIILSLGVVGQSLNLFTLSEKSLKSPCFVYLKSVALAELLSVFFLAPFVVRHVLKWQRRLSVRPYWALWYEAHLEIPLINSFVSANSLSIAALTTERYFSVCHPLLARTWFANVRRAQLISAILYALAVFIFIPACFQKFLIATLDEYGVNVTVSVRNYDLHNSTWFNFYLIFREILVRIGPIVVVIVLNILILIAFRRATLKRRRLTKRTTTTTALDAGSTSRSDAIFVQVTIRGSHNGALPDGPKSELRKGKPKDFYEKQNRFYALLTITVLTFLICTLPASVLSLLITNRMNAETNVEFQIFRAAANLLEIFSYCTNFYIYCMCSSDYRQAFLNKLGFSRAENPISLQTVPTDL